VVAFTRTCSNEQRRINPILWQQRQKFMGSTTMGIPEDSSSSLGPASNQDQFNRYLTGTCFAVNVRACNADQDKKVRFNVEI
jgi:hypothetical protein